MAMPILAESRMRGPELACKHQKQFEVIQEYYYLMLLLLVGGLQHRLFYLYFFCNATVGTKKTKRAAEATRIGATATTQTNSTDTHVLCRTRRRNQFSFTFILLFRLVIFLLFVQYLNIML